MSQTLLLTWHKGELCPYKPVLRCSEGFCDGCSIYWEVDSREARKVFAEGKGKTFETVEEAVKWLEENVGH